jgi:hypothetical protein
VQFVGSGLLSWAGCEICGLVFPLRRGDFAVYMRRRGMRGLGRIFVALGVVGVGAGLDRGAPMAVALGALCGWFLAAGREAWRERRIGAGPHAE